MKNTLRIGALAAAAALALAACSSAPEDEPTTSRSAAETTTSAQTVDYKACMVSDAGGFDDKSFNQTSFEGLQQAEADLGIDTASAESADGNAYGPNLEALVSSD